MIAAVKHSLANLANFSGRDARSTFWLYMLFLVILKMVAFAISQWPIWTALMAGAMDAARAGVDPDEMNQAMLAGVSGDDLRRALYIGTLAAFAGAALYAASFVRRLHDSGKAWWWLLVALVPFLYPPIISILDVERTVAVAKSGLEASPSQAELGERARQYIYSGIGLLGYLVTIIFGVLESDDGPNKYGEQPVSLG